jgi:hypothetical protein
MVPLSGIVRSKRFATFLLSNSSEKLVADGGFRIKIVEKETKRETYADGSGATDRYVGGRGTTADDAR